MPPTDNPTHSPLTDFRLQALENSHERLQEALAEIADEIKKLAQAVVSQAQDRKTLELVQADLAALRTSVQAAETARLARENEELRRASDARARDARQAVYDTLRVVFIAGFTSLCAHFGLKIFAG